MALMSPWTIRSLLLALILCLFTLNIAKALPSVGDHGHYDLDVVLQPQKQHLEVDLRYRLPKQVRAHSTVQSTTLYFTLHKDLTITELNQPYEVENSEGDGLFKRYQVRLTNPTITELVMHYQGNIHHDILSAKQNYQRSFADTPGIIDAKGVYLDGGSYWYPHFDHGLFDFALEVTLPHHWHSISQGDLSANNGIEHWQSPQVMPDIYLIAAPFTIYRQPYSSEFAAEHKPISIEAYLRTKDNSLANKYIQTAQAYMAQYEALLGPYPYGKFALVENFWQTGFGMPSFTLLGDKIIRFPFILHSSYPHELLHNWWGNGVFTSPVSGNWSEGLTTYLADHLIAEQKQKADDYRRDALKRFSNTLEQHRHMSLSQFSSRDSAATEALGYVKGMMVWEMLRNELGDEAFISGLRRFYRDNLGKQAGFKALQQAFELAAKRKLDLFFSQWVQRQGAPKLALARIKLSANDSKQGGYRLSFELRQTQLTKAFSLHVPVQVANQTQSQTHWLDLNAKHQQFNLFVPFKPSQLAVDNQFQLMRQLDPKESAPTLGGAFAGEQWLVILPQNAERKTQERYQKLYRQWQTGDIQVTVAKDNEDIDFGDFDTIWLFDNYNQQRPLLSQWLPNNTLASELLTSTDTVVMSAANPKQPEQTLVYMHLAQPDALDALARKLPHYGKYSYVTFATKTAVNRLKGIWPASHSPLIHHFDNSVVVKAPARRGALIKPPSAFSAKQFKADVEALTAHKMQGRGVGTKGIELAADYIFKALSNLGLEVKNQYFDVDINGKPVTTRNIIAKIPGSAKAFADAPVILSAHYDHLGFDIQGIPFPGADDNASGVAVLLALAAHFKQYYPARPIVFAAFSAEEHGLQGAKHYLNTLRQQPVFALVNLDIIGRLGSGPIHVLGSDSSRQWPHIFMGAGFVTGHKVQMSQLNIASSDHAPFIEAGIPAVHIFASAHFDVHHHSDIPNKLDYQGMVDIAEVTTEVIEYLSQRKEPLTNNSAATKTKPSSSNAQGRKVSTGILPDYSFKGPGVRVAQVADNSPALQSGIQKDDVIVTLGGKTVNDLTDYSAQLKALKPGDKLKLTLNRDGRAIEVEVVLGVRE